MPEKFYPVASAPQYGDIVWARFPYDEVPGPGPKPRPALVLATCLHTRNGEDYATVQCAYGTSKLRLNELRSRLDLKIQNVGALNAARLPQATRFDLQRVRWLPWAEDWFEPREGQLTPTVGRLPGDYIQKLEVLRVARQAFQAKQSGEDDC